MLNQIFRLVGEMEGAVIVIYLFTELIEVIPFYFDPGGASVTTAADDRVLGVFEGIGEIKVAETAAGAFVKTRSPAVLHNAGSPF